MTETELKTIEQSTKSVSTAMDSYDDWVWASIALLEYIPALVAEVKKLRILIKGLVAHEGAEGFSEGLVNELRGLELYD